ncbi:MAG: hypothetical protein JEZ09_15625 [Salinivirgaceae bacterium]|nr:hypothetical protein [Salinivirgaceae bacterium]
MNIQARHLCALLSLSVIVACGKHTAPLALKLSSHINLPCPTDKAKIYRSFGAKKEKRLASKVLGNIFATDFIALRKD